MAYIIYWAFIIYFYCLFRMAEIEANDSFEELSIDNVTDPGVRIERMSPTLERITVDGLEVFSSNDASVLSRMVSKASASNEVFNSLNTINEVKPSAGVTFHQETSIDTPTANHPSHENISKESPPKKNPTRNTRKRPISGASTRSSIEIEDSLEVKIELPELSGDEDDDVSDGGGTASSISSASRRMTRQASRPQPSPSEPTTRSGKGSRSASAAASKDQAAGSGGMRLRLRVSPGTPSKDSTPSTPHGTRSSNTRTPASNDSSANKAGSRELRSSVSDSNGRELRPRRPTIPKIDEDNELDEDAIDELIIDDEPLFTPSARHKGVR